MNVQSEIEYFSELTVIDKARFLSLLMNEMSDEVKNAFGPSPDKISDSIRVRFAVELQHRLTRFIYQVLSEDPARPSDEVIVRMLLSTRVDKSAERMVVNAYRRALQGFDKHDTTVLLNN